jgi:hypothetical protein
MQINNTILPFFFFLTFTPLLIHAQGQVCRSACTGNLGENIFPNGDFGVGVANILATDPRLAPGYIYTTFPPPNDGFYTITNNTTSWGSFAARDWADIKDNSPNPNGYMMVVNASYTPGLFFEKKVPVCANTLYEFSIDVVSIAVASATYLPILPNLSFLIDGKEVCSTGNVAADGKWYVFRFSFSTPPTASEVLLSLRNNAPGGIGNDLAIDNISFRACGPEIDVPVTVPFCAGQSVPIAAQLANSPYSNPVFQWQRNTPAGWQDIAGASQTSYTIPTPGSGEEYRLVVANAVANLSLAYCRSVSDTIKPKLEDLSKYAITGTDTIVCNGAPALLDAGKYRRYRWTTGDTTATIKAPAPGWYGVEITTQNGCTATDSLNVYEVRLAGTADFTPPSCYGYSDGSIQVANLLGGTGTVRFTIDGVTFQTETLFEGLRAKAYTVTLADSLNCRVVIPLQITQPDSISAVVDGPATITEGSSAPLQAVTDFTPVRFDWSPPESLSCTDCPSPVAAPTADVVYVLRATDAQGCFSTDTLSVKVTPNRDVYVPNVFLPERNATELNNFFSVFPASQNVTIRRLLVADRWGNMVFLRENLLPDDAQLRWNGRAPDGRRVPVGVYVWMLELEYYDGVRLIRSGDVVVAE